MVLRIVDHGVCAQKLAQASNYAVASAWVCCFGGALLGQGAIESAES